MKQEHLLWTVLSVLATIVLLVGIYISVSVLKGTWNQNDTDPFPQTVIEENTGEEGERAPAEDEQPQAELPAPEETTREDSETALQQKEELPAMPMYDIIDGELIMLSISEEQFAEIADFLRQRLSINDAALAGILSNLQGEAGYDPHKIGDMGEAFGICQWRGPRLEQMVAYCKEYGLDPITLEGQLSFLAHDLNNNYTYAFDMVRTCPDTTMGAVEATYNFCAYYEAPAEPEYVSVGRERLTKLLIYPRLKELRKAR